MFLRLWSVRFIFIALGRQCFWLTLILRGYHKLNWKYFGTNMFHNKPFLHCLFKNLEILEKLRIWFRYPDDKDEIHLAIALNNFGSYILGFRIFGYEGSCWCSIMKMVFSAWFIKGCFLVLQHWLDTAAGGLLDPEGIVSLVVSTSVLKWFKKKISKIDV